MSSSAATRRWWSLFCVCPAHFHCPPKVSARINAHIPRLPLCRERACRSSSRSRRRALRLSLFSQLFHTRSLLSRCLVVVVIATTVCQFSAYRRVRCRKEHERCGGCCCCCGRRSCCPRCRRHHRFRSFRRCFYLYCCFRYRRRSLPHRPSLPYNHVYGSELYCSHVVGIVFPSM